MQSKDTELEGVGSFEVGTQHKPVQNSSQSEDPPAWKQLRKCSGGLAVWKSCLLAVMVASL
uniref:Uncharacterized protein n=1 Tax=Rhizophora mucronata TaxID=61149 RepID=A0A2P2L9Z0_RHIMU